MLIWTCIHNYRRERPSLARLDLPALAGRAFFSVNRGYLAYSQGIPTIPHHMFADPLGYSTWATETRAAHVGLRFCRSDVCATPEYAIAPDREPAVELSFHMTPGMEDGHFATHLSEGLYRGYTIATNCAQIAFHMGFTEVYLIGCDFSYDRPTTHFYELEVLPRERFDDAIARLGPPYFRSVQLPLAA